MKSGLQPAKGLYLYNPLKDIFTYQPLRLPNECINAILEGEDCLWLTTAKGTGEIYSSHTRDSDFH
mgnify:CR=1 FL=1